MGALHNSPSMFAITRTKILLVVTLGLTWWFSFLLPHYTPAIQREFSSRLDDARQKMPTLKIDWKPQPEYDPRMDYDPSKVVLIIEPRAIPTLVPQLLHMMFVVPPEWRFVFIGSEKSVAAVGRIMSIKHQQVIGKLDLMVLPEPWEIDTKEKTFRMLTDIRFYDEFLPGVEYIIKYEHDSILCANSGVGINEWLEWSWAGAQDKPGDRFSGNGGLTFRRVSAIRKILRFQARFNDSDPEDQWFGNRLWVLPGEKVAHQEEGVFAVEKVYTKNPMGFHIRDGKDLPAAVWQDPTQRKEIFEYCPELSMIMDMKLEFNRCPGDDRKGHIDDTEQKKKADAEAKKKADEEAKRKADEEAKKKADEEAKKKAEEAAKAANPA